MLTVNVYVCRSVKQYKYFREKNNKNTCSYPVPPIPQRKPLLHYNGCPYRHFSVHLHNKLMPIYSYIYSLFFSYPVTWYFHLVSFIFDSFPFSLTVAEYSQNGCNVLFC